MWSKVLPVRVSCICIILSNFMEETITLPSKSEHLFTYQPPVCQVRYPGLSWWPRDLPPSIFPSISCVWCPRYCNFLVLNCRTISLPVPIILNTFSLVILSVHDIFESILCDIRAGAQKWIAGRVGWGFHPKITL